MVIWILLICIVLHEDHKDLSTEKKNMDLLAPQNVPSILGGASWRLGAFQVLSQVHIGHSFQI